MSNDCHVVWDSCLKFIQENIPEQSFKTWFKPIIPVKLDDKVLTIQVPSQFFYEWLEEHYLQLLRKSILQEIGPEGRLEYSIIVDQGFEKQNPYTINLPTSGYSDNGHVSTAVASKTLQLEREFGMSNNHVKLNQNYTFDSFIEGDCNRLARSAGYAVAKKPGITSFNPLMLYGGVGLGKTHLVQAIGNYIQHYIRDKSVIYVSSEKFTNEFIEALKNNNLQKFTNFYLKVDVLIIDDVQFLSGKEKTQEMFFHIFNHLHQSGKQIIMTSDRPPKELKGLQDRLLSRFKWGLTADLQQPDLETRIAIIQKKIQNEGLDISEEVIEYLAHTIDSNIRELEGVIVSLLAQASLNRKGIDLNLAKKTVMHIVQGNHHDQDKTIDIDYVQNLVATYFDLSVDDLKAKTRKKHIVTARQIAMYLIKEHTNFSLKSIGYNFGGRDHSTVIHAVQTVSDMLEEKDEVKSWLKDLQAKIRF